MEISYLEQNDRNVIKYEPVIYVYNKNGDFIARYDSNVISYIKIEEAVHDKNCCNVGNFVGRIMDLKLDMAKVNLDFSAFYYVLSMHYLDDSSCLLYPFDEYEQPDTTQRPIGLTYEDDLYDADVLLLGSESQDFNYTWSTIPIGYFFVTDCKYNRDSKCYELELTDIPEEFDNIMPKPDDPGAGVGYVLVEDMYDKVSDALFNSDSTAYLDFVLDNDVANMFFDYSNVKDYLPSARELIANMAFLENANAYMSEYNTVVLRRFGENKQQESGSFVSWTTPEIDYEKIDDYYFEQSAPYQYYLKNVELENTGKKIQYAPSFKYGSTKIKNRLWSQIAYVNGTINRNDSVLNYMQSWSYEGEPLWHIRAGDHVIIDNDDVYIGQISNYWEGGSCNCSMSQQLLVSGDYLMIQVSGNQSYEEIPYVPPADPVVPLNQITLPNLKNTLQKYYSGEYNPTVTNNKVTWENGCEWSVGDTIDIDVAAIPANVSTTTVTHNAITLTYKVIGINHDTITGTNTKALLTLWPLTPYLDDNSIVTGDGLDRYAVSTASGNYYGSIIDWGSGGNYPHYDSQGWYSQHQMAYSKDPNYTIMNTNVLFSWLEDCFIPALPQEIQDSLKHVDKLYFTKSQTSDMTLGTASWGAWILSESEVRDHSSGRSGWVGKTKEGSYFDGNQYKYFADNGMTDLLMDYSWGVDPYSPELVYDCAPQWLRTPSSYTQQLVSYVASKIRKSTAALDQPLTTAGGTVAYCVQPCICL